MQNCLVPPSIRFRELVDRTVLIGAAYLGRTVEIARSIDGQITVRVAAVRASGEAVQHGEIPISVSWSQLKYISHCVGAAVLRRAVKIARNVEGEAVRGASSVLSAREIVKGGLSPRVTGRCELEYRTVTVKAALAGRAVEIASRVEGQWTYRIIAAIAGEAVNNGLRPRAIRIRHKLEHRAVIVFAASLGCRTVKVTGAISNHA